MFNITDFYAGLTGGGARASLFQVVITNPVNGAADIKTPFMCKAAALPGLNINPVEVPYFGRKIKLAGNRTYEDWTVTIINDEDMSIRNAMEQWSNAINSFQGNLRTAGGSSPSLYKSVARLNHYGKDGTMLREYNMVGIFPTVISPIELNWDTDGAVEEFQVTFAYDYFEVTGGITGNAGGI